MGHAVKLLAFDTEDDSKGNVKIINFYDGENHYTFKDPKSALDWLSGQGESFYDINGHELGSVGGSLEIWATNLGYDLNNLFQGFFHSLQITYVGTRVISATLYGSKVYFRDSLNHWKMSVKEMGKRIGLHKIETKEFVNVKYCRRDTEITYRFVMAMKKEYEKMGCQLKATIGSTALDYFYSNFWPRPDKSEVLEKNEVDFIHDGLYGGRVEIFFTKPVEGNIFYVDINSLYPAVMRANRYPDLSSRYWVNGKTINLENEGMADVTIEAPKNETIPYLPIRSDRGLIFPTGILRGHYTFFEIREALNFNYRLKKVHKALEFDKFCYPFREFVDVLWLRRERSVREKDELMKDTCKLLMNNLFGKFGQGNVHTKLVPFKSKSNLRHGDILYGAQVLREMEGPYQPHANAIWSALTTAYGRSRLYRDGLKRVETGGGLLLYCDTDAVLYLSDRKIISTSKELGEFKDEAILKYAYFKQPKVYHLIPKKGKHAYKAKGVPKVVQKRFFKNHFAQFRRPKKLRECLRRAGGIAIGNKSSTNINFKYNFSLGAVVEPRKYTPNYWDLTKKELTQIYNKRRKLKNGETRPLHIERSTGL